MAYFGRHDDGFFGRGFYFSPDAEEARDYGPIVMPVYLKIERPFRIPSAGEAQHLSLLDLRDRLAHLRGMPADLLTDRKVHEGYRLTSFLRDEDGMRISPDYPARPGQKLTRFYYVEPKPELYGTDREIYGPENTDRTWAIVLFNDDRRDASYDEWWAPGLLKRVGRDRFDEVLADNGHDGILVYDPYDGSPIEYVVFRPEQIKSATDNDGSFDATDPDMRSNPGPGQDGRGRRSVRR
jgi:hypothetical protein